MRSILDDLIVWLENTINGNFGFTVFLAIALVVGVLLGLALGFVIWGL